MKKRKVLAGIVPAVVILLISAAVILVLRPEPLYTEDVVIEGEGYTLQVPNCSDEFDIMYSAYDAETDWDWTHHCGHSNIVEAEGNYYVRLQEYIYICDFENDRLIPLCNRPDCLHDKETEPTKKSDCSAYVPGTTLNALQYYDGKLYANAGEKVDSDSGMGFYGDYVYEIALDGSGRKLLPVICENALTIMVHRGNIYYCSQSTYQEGKQMIYEVREVPLKGGENRLIAHMECDPDFVGLSDLCPYGECLYIAVSGGGNQIILYNIEKQVSQVVEQDQEYLAFYPEGENIYMVRHDLYELIYPDGYPRRIQGATEIYTMDLNGENIKEYGQLPNEDVTQLGLEPMVGGKCPYISMDENYIYQMMNMGWLFIYDRTNFEVVKKIPLGGVVHTRVGGTGDYLIISDGNFIPGILWLEKDRMLEDDAEFHILKP